MVLHLFVNENLLLSFTNNALFADLRVAQGCIQKVSYVTSGGGIVRKQEEKGSFRLACK
jgi:hypothetical protein